MKKLLLLVLVAFTFSLCVPEAGAAPAASVVAKVKAAKAKKHHKHGHKKHRKHRTHARKQALAPMLQPGRAA